MSLNLLLFNLKKLHCIDFQIQDLSSEKQFITSVSFILPIQNCQKKLEHKFNEYESNFLKFNSFKFVQHQTNNSKFHFVLENILKSRKSNEFSYDFNTTKMIKSENVVSVNLVNPYLNLNRKRLSEEIIKDDRNTISEENLTSDRETNFNRNNCKLNDFKEKQKKSNHCSKVLEINWQMKKENLEEKKNTELDTCLFAKVILISFEF